MNDPEGAVQDPFKKESYRRLVEKRKNCHLCLGLSNPSDEPYRQFDSDHIGPWSLWQGNLNADLLIVGQDWGDTSYFLKWQWRDQPHGNPTNENLQRLLEKIFFRVDRPREEQRQVIFLDNLVLCLKEGGLQGRVDDQWFKNCTTKFFIPLVDVIKPRAVLALGKKTATTILDAYQVKYPKTTTLVTLMHSSPYRLSDATVLFPLFHCGAGSVNRDRSMTEQMSDWENISEWLNRKCV